MAYELAFSADPSSAYGAVLAFNRPVDAAVAAAIQTSKVFFELLAAPGFSQEAVTLLGKRRNLRLMELPENWEKRSLTGPDVKRVQGGWLVQSWDSEKKGEWRPLVRNSSEEEQRLLQFAWILCRNVRSNAIVLAKGEGAGVVTNGIGSGQMSRLDAVSLALQKAKRPVVGSVLASDAFFAFTDSVKMALEAGVAAIIQPGGGTKDAEIITLMAEKGAAMVMTDIRHFRH
jgi:phosphoribosylaminoimidazolecarboxamide formyltransferase/IMP cyclohydrolase